MMRKGSDSQGNEKGGQLKQRLRGVRRRKQVQERLGQEATSFRMRLVEGRGRIDR